METKQQHRGKDALNKILRDIQTTHDGYLAIQYLAERIEQLENKANRSAAFHPPTAVEVTEYAKSIGYDLSGQTFTDYYATRNWFVGKQKMKDWRAAVRYWRSLRETETKAKHKSESDTIPIRN